MGSELKTLAFDGDELEVVELDDAGWVSIPSLLRPFGKRADNMAGLWDGWGRVRVEVLPSRKGEPGNPRTTLIHVKDAPLLIARMDKRGMDDDIKEKHNRYLRLVAGVLAEHFGLKDPAPPTSPDPWAAIQAVAAGALELRADVKQAKTDASTAARAALDAEKTAREAKTIAEQARTMAGARGVLDTLAGATPPGGSSATPDGAWSAKAPMGYKSMRAVAREFALPSDGIGCGFVGKVARALGVHEDLHAVAYQDVVIGGRARRQHMVYGPKALALLDGPLRAAHAAMVARGYVTRHGVLCPAGVGPAKRAKDFVLAEMFEAAASGRAEVPDERQQTIPGVDEQRKAG